MTEVRPPSSTGSTWAWCPWRHPRGRRPPDGRPGARVHPACCRPRHRRRIIAVDSCAVYSCAGCSCAGCSCAGCSCAGYSCAVYSCAVYSCGDRAGRRPGGGRVVTRQGQGDRLLGCPDERRRQRGARLRRRDRRSHRRVHLRASFSSSATQKVLSNTTSFTSVPGTKYCLRVRAINAAGNGTGCRSGPVSVTALTEPGAPGTVAATSPSRGTLTVTWAAPADDGGTEITGYDVEIDDRTGSSTCASSFNDSETTTVTGTSATFTGLDGTPTACASGPPTPRVTAAGRRRACSP